MEFKKFDNGNYVYFDNYNYQDQILTIFIITGIRDSAYGIL